jgi:Na+/pantothenate symporter
MTAASQYSYINRVKIMAEIECRIIYFHPCIPSFLFSYLLSFFTDNLAYKEKWVEQKTQSRKWME